MASNGASTVNHFLFWLIVIRIGIDFFKFYLKKEQGVRDVTENSLEKIKRQLASGSGRNLLQGPLLKRSETV